MQAAAQRDFLAERGADQSLEAVRRSTFTVHEGGRSVHECYGGAEKCIFSGAKGGSTDIGIRSASNRPFLPLLGDLHHDVNGVACHRWSTLGNLGERCPGCVPSRPGALWATWEDAARLGRRGPRLLSYRRCGPRCRYRPSARHRTGTIRRRADLRGRFCRLHEP
jgi:hypothetical protein